MEPSDVGVDAYVYNILMYITNLSCITFHMLFYYWLYVVTEQLYMHINDSETYSRVYQSWVNSLINLIINSVCISEAIFIMLENLKSENDPLLFSLIYLPPPRFVVVGGLELEVGSWPGKFVCCCIEVFFSFCFNTASWYVIFQTVTLRNEFCIFANSVFLFSPSWLNRDL